MSVVQLLNVFFNISVKCCFYAFYKMFFVVLCNWLIAERALRLKCFTFKVQSFNFLEHFSTSFNFDN